MTLGSAACAFAIALPDGSLVTAALSVGVTMAGPEEAIEQVIARADRAMYEAKRAGGNSVTVVG